MSETAAPVISERPGARPGHRTTLRVIALVAVPSFILAGALYTYFNAASYWTRFQGLSLAFALSSYVAAVTRGRFRDVAVIAASLSLGFAAVEAYFVLHYRTAIDTNTPGYSVNMAVLGWGPAHPGVYHHHKVDPRTGRVIVDVDYTIDEHLTRKVESAADGPTIAIGGGSNVFGTGLPDSATLPQEFADAVGRRLHVVNLAFSGYGAQHFLRILETGLHDDVLTKLRVFVLSVSPELAEQTACTLGYTLAGPSYEVVGGQVKFAGTCAEQWSLPLRWLFEITSLYDIVALRLDQRTPRQKLEVYIAILSRVGQVAREKYGVPTALLYFPGQAYAQRAGISDDELMGRLRADGLIVINEGLDEAAFRGHDLWIPGDGHPTAIANRAFASLLLKGLSGFVSLDP